MSADGGGDKKVASGGKDVKCCSSCGIAEKIDNEITLTTKCNTCDLVQYCGTNCQEDHKPKHEEECKTRAAEVLRDERLFHQPEANHLGDCPICCIPLPYDVTRCAMQLCCSKVICKGCFIANFVTERRQKLKPKCPFCRETLKSKAKVYKNTMKRIKAGDPVATFQFAADCKKAGDFSKAFEYYTKATELGDIEAHLRLAGMYHNEEGVTFSVEKEIYHLEAAALGGHPIARHTLGSHEMVKGNFERGMKHYIIASKLGNKMSMESVMDGFRRGFVTKEELSATLRTHQAAYDAMNTPERVKIEASLEKLGLN